MVRTTDVRTNHKTDNSKLNDTTCLVHLGQCYKWTINNLGYQWPYRLLPRLETIIRRSRVQFSFHYLYVIPIVTTFMAAVLGLFFKRWYGKACERQDKRDKLFYYTIRRVSAQHYAVAKVFEAMNGHGKSFQEIYEKKLQELEKEDLFI